MQLAITSLYSETLEIYIYKCLAYERFRVGKLSFLQISSALNFRLLLLK
jgi:hypothetical protein